LRSQAAQLRERTDLIAGLLVTTILAAERAGRPQAENTFSLQAGRLRAAVGLARGRLRLWLERSGVDPEIAADIALACSEACANAVEHPVSPRRHAFEVEARRTPAEIELAVRDFGVWRDNHGPGHRGRGLRMIRELMDATEIVKGDHETTIVMRRARRQPAA